MRIDVSGLEIGGRLAPVSAKRSLEAHGDEASAMSTQKRAPKRSNGSADGQCEGWNPSTIPGRADRQGLNPCRRGAARRAGVSRRFPAGPGRPRWRSERTRSVRVENASLPRGPAACLPQPVRRKAGPAMRFDPPRCADGSRISVAMASARFRETGSPSIWCSRNQSVRQSFFSCRAAVIPK